MDGEQPDNVRVDLEPFSDNRAAANVLVLGPRADRLDELFATLDLAGRVQLTELLFAVLNHKKTRKPRRSPKNTELISSEPLNPAALLSSSLLFASSPTSVALPASYWTPEVGRVMWWRFPLEDEAPFVGTPADADWPPDHDGVPHYTHWTPIPTPLDATP